MSIGGFLSHPLTAENVEIENKHIVRKWKWIKLLLIPISIIVFALFYKAYTSYLLDIGSVARAEIFGADSVLFPSGNIELLYGMVTRTSLLVSIVGGISLFIYRLDWGIFIFSTFLYVLDSVMMLGRKNIYGLIIISAYMLYVMTPKVVDERVKQARRYGLMLSISLVVLVVGITSFRVGEKFDFKEVAKRYVVAYHTGGFVLVDKQLQDKNSRLNKNITFGRSTLGALEKSTVVLLLRSFDTSVVPATNRTGADFREFRKIGVSPEGDDLVLNAFNTILYTLYIDGREPFLILMCFLYGWFMMGHYSSWIRQKRLHSLMMSSFFAYIGFIGLFNSPIGSGMLWGGLLLIVGLNRIKLPVPTVNLKQRLIN
jgi:oligosaccharide repeat unit polymerase